MQGLIALIVIGIIIFPIVLLIMLGSLQGSASEHRQALENLRREIEKMREDMRRDLRDLRKAMAGAASASGEAREAAVEAEPAPETAPAPAQSPEAVAPAAPPALAETPPEATPEPEPATRVIMEDFVETVEPAAMAESAETGESAETPLLPDDVEPAAPVIPEDEALPDLAWAATTEPEQPAPPEASDHHKKTKKILEPRVEWTAPEPEPEPSAFASAMAEIWGWIRQNPLFFGGLALFLTGMAFALGWLVAHNHISPGARLALIGLTGCAMQGLGWKARVRRRLFGVGLIGGGSVVLYFTLFAAWRLALLSPWAALAFMVALVLETCALALLTDAQVLAVVATAGAFSAPLLIDTGSADFTALFGYYALLAIGATLLSTLRGWDIPVLLACAAVYGIGGLWGAHHYRPELLAQAEFFVILFFAVFTWAHFQLARHADAAHAETGEAGPARRLIHATLLCGMPILTFTYHYWLTRHLDWADAGGALALAGFDLGLVWLLRRVEGPALRLTRDAMAVMGIAFSVLAVPLALNASWTTCAWSIQGLAFLWLGIRQERPLVRGLGYAMQLLAAATFFFMLVPSAEPGNRRACEVVLSLSALTLLWLCRRGREVLSDWEEGLQVPWQFWTLGFWAAAGLDMLTEHFAPGGQSYANAALVFAAASSGFWGIIGARLGWRVFANIPALLPVIWLAAQWRFLPQFLWLPVLPMLDWIADGQTMRAPLAAAHGGLYALPLAWLAFVGFFRYTDWPETAGGRTTLVNLGLLSMLGLILFSIQAGMTALLPAEWQACAPPALVLFLALWLWALSAAAKRPVFPVFGRYAEDLAPERLLRWNGAVVVCCLAFWFLALCGRFDRNFVLPYVPILSPVDLTQLFCLAGCLFWIRAGEAIPRGLRDQARLIWGLALFLLANVIAARTVCAWTGCLYNPQALAMSPAFRTTLSVLWGAVSLGLMITASHVTRSRRRWRLGLVLLLVTLGKLVFFDLADSETIHRSLSFLAVGLLMLGMGWFCPLPPKEEEAK